MEILKKILKIAGILIFIFALGVTFLLLYGKYRPVIIQKYYEYKQEKYLEQMEEEVRRIDEARRADTYGGETPEETLRLLIDALEKGDIELASKYYDVESKLIEYKKFDDLEKIIKNSKNILEKGTKRCFDDGCVIEFFYTTEVDEYVSVINTDQMVFIPAGTKDRMLMEFIKNPYSNLWKIF